MSFSALLVQLQGLYKTTLTPIVWHYIITLSPIFAAVFLGIIFFDVWLRYIRLRTFLKAKYTLLELKLPKDTFKSPLAMETVFHALHISSAGNWYGRFWEGKVRAWFSLEMISIEGVVKFIIWTEDKHKRNIMTALYAQYPGIEIKEMEDYTKDVQWDPKVWKIWGAEYEHTKKEPYPIKTYLDYGLDKDPKEEYKIDPLSHVVEWLGSLRPNEQAWIQIIIRAHIKDQIKPGHLWKTHDKWKDDAAKEVDKILLRDPKTKLAGPKAKEGIGAQLAISEGEKDLVNAIERSRTKLPFDTCIRAMYIAKADVFDGGFGASGLSNSLKQFNSEALNGFKPAGDRWLTKIGDYPWQDYRDTRRNNLSSGILKAYRRRSAFYPPNANSKKVVLNTEELATIFHMPGSTVATPTFERIPSKKGEAPSNLPV